MKNPLTLAGIEPEAFPFVAQRLNHWSPLHSLTVSMVPLPRAISPRGNLISNSRIKKIRIITDKDRSACYEKRRLIAVRLNHSIKSERWC